MYYPITSTQISSCSNCYINTVKIHEHTKKSSKNDNCNAQSAPLKEALLTLKYIVSRGVGSPPACRWKFWFPPSIFSPLGLQKLSSPPQEASVISVPTNRQVRLTAMLWSKKSSAYKLLKVSRVINDFKIALNKVKYSKNLFLKLLLNQYHFQSYFCVGILSSSPWLIQKKLIPPPKKFLHCLWKFSIPPASENSNISFPPSI